MHHYGRQAMTHWQRWLPTRYATIADPETFFQALGQQVEAEIIELTPQLAGPDQTDETYLQKAGRLTEARARAESMVLREQVLLDPEPGVDPDR